MPSRRAILSWGPDRAFHKTAAGQPIITPFRIELLNMIEVTLSNGKVVDAERITKVCLWNNPIRLQVFLSESEPPVTVHTPTAVEDANRLDSIRDEHRLHYGVFRSPMRAEG